VHAVLRRASPGSRRQQLLRLREGNNEYTHLSSRQG
jgi:hypothetical protein